MCTFPDKTDELKAIVNLEKSQEDVLSRKLIYYFKNMRNQFIRLNGQAGVKVEK